MVFEAHNQHILIFLIVALFELILSVFSLQSKQYVSIFCNDGNILLTINFKHFDFIEWFDLSSSSHSLFETLSINGLLFDLLMSLFISPNLTYSSQSFSFFFYLCQCVIFHQFILLIYAQQNTNHFYRLKYYAVAIFFHLKMILLFLISLIVLYSVLYHIA